MSAESRRGSVTRRRFLQLSAAGAAAAAAPSAASAQTNSTDSDGGDTETTGFEMPTDTITTDPQGGATEALTRALNEAQVSKEPFGVDPPGNIGDNADVPVTIQEAIVMQEECQYTDHQFLTQFYNLLRYARSNAYWEGKDIVLTNLDQGATKQQTIDGAKSQVTQYYAQTQQNLLNIWTTRINQLEAEFGKVTDFGHPEVYTMNGSGYSTGSGGLHWTDDIQFKENFTVDLVDGETKTVKTYYRKAENRNGDGSTQGWYYQHVTPTGMWQEPDGDQDSSVNIDVLAQTVNAETRVTSSWGRWESSSPTTKAELEDSGTDWDSLQSSNLTFNMWSIIWSAIENQHQDALDNIEAYAEEAWTAVDTGRIDVDTLASESLGVLATQWNSQYSETGHYSLAAADMAASGLSYDLENQLVVALEDGSTLRGTLYASNDGFEYEVGQTYDPDGIPGMVYMAYSGGDAERQLVATSDYRLAIENGEMVLYTDVVRDATYHLETATGETATVQGSDFVPVSPNARYNPTASTDWKVDVSSKLPNTELNDVRVTRPGDTGGNVIRITQPFTIQEAYNVESGEPVETVEGEDDAKQTVRVGLTEEEVQGMLDTWDHNDTYHTQAAGPGGGGGSSVDFNVNGDDIVPDVNLPGWINPRNAVIAILAILGIGAATSG